MAYIALITSPMKKAERISRSFGFFAGKCNVTDYDSGTILEITGITKYFATGGVSGFTHGLVAVIPTGMSDNGHAFEWNYASGAFKAYTPTTITISGSGTGAGLTVDLALNTVQAVSTQGTVVAAGTEVSAATDVGEVGFIAIGFLKG